MNKLIPMEHYRELVWQRAINSLLLQVLKDTLNELRHWHGWRVNTSPGYADSDGCRICQGCIDLARAAIAKAEGRQS